MYRTLPVEQTNNYLLDNTIILVVSRQSPAFILPFRDEFITLKFLTSTNSNNYSSVLLINTDTNIILRRWTIKQFIES